MTGFDSKFISELKAKNDLVDIAGKYVHLEQRGNSFWGRCPLHHEKTPSFAINGPEQFYHCFGCHKSGDVISFIMELESLDFNDAVKFLAERAKMPLPEAKYDSEKVKEQKYRKERVLSLLKDAARFYVSNLKKAGSEKHIEYILRRNISGEYVSRFGIGASLDFNGLPQFLHEKGYTYDEMTDSGAVGVKNGRYYDALGGRLIIPVIDQFNNVVAFCGRVLESRPNVGKYVNTKETIVFSKAKTFFNLKNLKAVKNDVGIDSVIVVEGHMDVISLVQGGFPNVVASMGTALTKDQARILKRYADKVFISYDGDAAGQKAAIRGLEILRDEGLEVKVVSLPDGMDPDDVVKKLGHDGYLNLLNNAMPLIDFKLDILKKTYDVNTVDGKRKFAANAMRVIKESPSPAEQEDLMKTVRDYTGFTMDALKRELYLAEVKKEDFAADNETVEPTVAKDRISVAARYVLAGRLFMKPYAAPSDLNDTEFDNPVHAQIKDYILSESAQGENPKFNSLYEAFDDNEKIKDELSEIAGLFNDDNKSYDCAQYYEDCLKTLKLRSIDKKTERLNKMFKEETSAEKRREIAAEISSLLTEKNRLTR